MIHNHNYRRLVDWLSSRKFFVIIICIFVFEALWIAVSGRFPMAFDEDFHLGIIKIYAHHLSPFFRQQPTNADAFGAVARDPSYLYHYLMSFPWRLITRLTSSFMIQVIITRLINVALFASSLVVYRQLLLKTKISKALIHIALLFFILTPLVPQVAAQINYDNLLILLVAVCLLVTVRFAEQLKQQKFNWRLLILIMILGLLTSLVKYAFVPIFLAIVFYVIWVIYVSWRLDKKRFKYMTTEGYKQLNTITKIMLLFGLMIVTGLFSERYMINVLRYRTPLPECNQVLSEQHCAAYGPWERNHQFELTKLGRSNWNPLTFTYYWGRKLGFNLMFALNGIASGFKVGKPLPLPRVIARVIAYSGPLLVLFYWKKIFNNQTIRFFGFVTLLYIGALWFQNYSDFLHLDQQVAVQGRYLLPVLLFIYLIIAKAFAQLLRGIPSLKVAFLSVVLVCFLIGGGVLTFIIHSDQAWYWHNQTIIRINQDVQRVLDPVVPGSHYVPS